MLKVYVDDSNVGVEPISVLAGWIADDTTWASFETEWTAALGMLPRLAYSRKLRPTAGPGSS
jgi:hypothetical protein